MVRSLTVLDPIGFLLNPNTKRRARKYHVLRIGLIMLALLAALYLRFSGTDLEARLEHIFEQFSVTHTE